MQRDGVENKMDGSDPAAIQGKGGVDEEQESGVGNEEEKDEVEEGQIVEGWKEVTPEKSSRSAKSLQYKPLQIDTTSRFAVLSNSKEDEEENVQGKDESFEKSDKEIEEDSSEEDKSEMEEVEERQEREILPRQSKLKHKVLTVASNHAKGKDPGKKRGYRKQH
ncbi:hypothetical protein BRARA_K01070 [Brassica rapa]|uniref:Uncharacterized protein n=1 Tax=Brassica campestris TaxID=3711 RepID=A0A397L6E4_BRACM|nr:hypothetical protein BRARA_K01070 [Brassica rapa]